MPPSRQLLHVDAPAQLGMWYALHTVRNMHASSARSTQHMGSAEHALQLQGRLAASARAASPAQRSALRAHIGYAQAQLGAGYTPDQELGQCGAGRVRVLRAEEALGGVNACAPENSLPARVALYNV